MSNTVDAHVFLRGDKKVEGLNLAIRQDRLNKVEYMALGMDHLTIFGSLEQMEQIAKAILSQLQQKQEQEMEEGEVSF